MATNYNLIRTSESLTWRKPIFKYVSGNEVGESLIIDPTVVTADALGRKILVAGTLLTQMTSGAQTGRYGPYASGASDGRQTITAGAVFILSQDVELTSRDDFGVVVQENPVVMGGWFGYCVFATANLTLNSATLSTVKTAMPTCIFM